MTHAPSPTVAGPTMTDAMPMPILNTFAGNPLNRAGDLRTTDGWLAEQAERTDALAMVFWDGRPLLEDHPDGPRLTFIDLNHARPFFDHFPSSFGVRVTERAIISTVRPGTSPITVI